MRAIKIDRLRVRTSSHAATRGSVFIETAIGLPIFLMLILIVIWIGTTANARISVHSAMIKATRLGATRGIIDDLNGENSIPAVASFKSSSLAPNPAFEAMLFYRNGPGEITDPVAGAIFYNTNTQRVFNTDLQYLPTEYLYTIAYLNETLRISLGSHVRYPCSKEPGCLECFFLHPQCHDCTNIASAAKQCNASCFDTSISQKNNSIAANSFTVNNMPRGSVHIECRYNLSDSILTPIFSLLNLIAPGSSQKAISITSDSISNIIEVPFPRVTPDT